MIFRKDFGVMKFDFCIGNPPYQEDVAKKGDRANPVYDKIMEAAYKIADVVEFVHPARFLFNAGQTPKAWNEKMLNDEHFKILYYTPKSEEVFPNVDIKGGVAISIRNANKIFGKIGAFSAFNELNTILYKVRNIESRFIDEFVSSQGMFKFSQKAMSEHPEISNAVGNGTGNKIISAMVEKLPEIFLAENPRDSEYIQMIAKTKSGRITRYIRRDYVQENKYIDAYKVFVPEANGTGAIGEVLSTPLIGEPLIGVTDTFICIGCYDNYIEAENTFKYIKTKFARAMLGILKVTQHNPKSVWKYIPLQNFTAESDINWSLSIHEIDQQLYKKYGLSDEEISFIETHIREMA